MPGKRKLRSEAWEYFDRSENGQEATCQVDRCGQVICTPTGCTSPLLRHLSTLHNIHINQMNKRGRKELQDPMSMLDSISRLAAEDGIPFAVLAKSVTMRKLLMLATKMTPPTSPNSIREILIKCRNEKKQEVIHELLKLKRMGKQFTVTLDEWTSAAKRRYLNVTLHTTDNFWNLGLSRITETCSATECKRMLEDRLEEFELTLSHIFCIVTDGASVMKRLGRICGRKQQLCFAHAVHLAVSDVFYKIVAPPPPQEPADANDSEDIESILPSDESISNDICSDSTDDDEIEYQPVVKEVIEKVRQLVKMFIASPKKLEVLQKYDEHCRNRSLILDIKTRWNSMVLMLERFYCMKDAIQKAMIDLRKPLHVNEEDFQLIHEIVEALEPVKLASEAMCRENANLLTADISLNFMMRKLSLLESDLGIQLKESMKSRISERRSVLTETIKYLHYGKLDRNDDFFGTSSRSTVVATIKEIYSSLSADEVDVLIDDNTDNTELSESLLVEISLEAELNKAIMDARSFNPCGNVVSARRQRDQGTTLRNEMSLFETTGRRGKILQATLDVLMTVKPTSVESERVFSGANNFCRKTRANLGDQSMDALVFLKSFFNK